MWPFSDQSQALITAKRAQRSTAVSAAPKFSPTQHSPFLKASASQIVQHIERGRWTATQVVTAYIARAAVAHEATNCLTEILFEEALKQAKELDAEFASTKKLRGPLHGVPLSVKLTSLVWTRLWGTPISWGNLLQPMPMKVVALLRAAGAIPIAKTNVPQTLFACECSNHVFGQTVNPFNPAFTSGGSSGGEAVMLTMDGSALGIGSDIGASLRTPAAFCGIYSLKPTNLRVSYVGAGEPQPGLEGVKSVAGPMARSIDDLEIFCRLTFGVHTARAFAIAPTLYREVKLPKKLRFGYYTDYYLKSSPATRRAVLETVTALQNQGHQCIEIEVPTRPGDPFENYVAMSSADGYKTLLSGAGSDPLEPALRPVAFVPALPQADQAPVFFRQCITWAIEFILKDKQMASFMSVHGKKPVQELFAWTARRDKYHEEFYAEVWNKHNLDGIIAPVVATPQLPLGSFGTVFPVTSTTALYNFLDLPAGCVPVTRVDAHKDALTAEWTAARSHSIVYKALYQGKAPMYDPVAMQGMPVAVQVVGRRWEDEKVLAMMHVVDNALGNDRGFGPGSWDAKTEGQ
ncbi:amidase [Mycena pura]|uniref:Amidase n=1 Tax=Mycena pura TaxID=153505 RepID=A0AAD6YHB8_9AGAR|nr:amidase [Mycena pura]